MTEACPDITAPDIWPKGHSSDVSGQTDVSACAGVAGAAEPGKARPLEPPDPWSPDVSAGTHPPHVDDGPTGAVGTNHPLATQTGLDTLRSGGNAMDAAVAISLSLGVVEPGMSGLGGDGFYQVHIAKTGLTRCWNATGAAPFAAIPNGFAARVAVRGALSVSTPGLSVGSRRCTAHWVRGRGRNSARPRSNRRATGFTHPPLPAFRRRCARVARRRPPQPRGVSRRPRDGRARAWRRHPAARSRPHPGGNRRGRGRNILPRRIGRTTRAGMREAGVLVDERDLDACQPEVQDRRSRSPIAAFA